MSHWRLHRELPIFGVDDGDVSAVYIAGHVMPTTREQLHQLRAIWVGNALTGDIQSLGMARELESVAADVKASWRRLHREDFTPVCLNIMLPYSCNLYCRYCYSRPARETGVLNRPAATAAARLVAANCARLGAPFQVDIQGEGEPTCRWDDLQWCVEMTQSAARDARSAWSSHMSTNGQTDDAQTEWIGRTFSHVTLSCDGPPDIQNDCRPRKNGEASSVKLEATAQRLASMMEALDARVTVTAANIYRLNDVVRYIAECLGVRSIRLEPAFAPASAEDIEPDPAVAAAMCLRAIEEGERSGIEVMLGSPRLTGLHGAYCQALRGILRIMPDGMASNCLRGILPTGQKQAYATAIGSYDAATGTYALDTAEIDRLRRAAEHIPALCRDCLNALHCCRNCPDQCPTADLRTKQWRCRFQEFVAGYWILSMAGQARETPHACGAGLQFRSRIKAETREISDTSVRDEILVNTQLAAQWRPLDQTYMPKAAWEDERFLRLASDAAEILTSAAAARDGNISVYVHLPFCRARCVFCDCHSVAAARDEKDEKFDAYIERLKRDIDIWRDKGGIGRRPVSTVHFGGGTPLVVGEDRFSELAAILGKRLNVHQQTEWAIETTSACAAPEHIDLLMRLGFRRLHVGVQTLNDDLRRKLGRTCRSTEVIERLCSAMKAGMTTSVDLIYGLPDQTIGMLLEDISLLVEAGIHGISLYRLNLSSRNQRLLRVFTGYRQSPLRSCVMLQAAESLLLRSGYGKNHFNHYALPPDDNRYYCHAVRGEDLIGLGASASGVIGDWEYRCLHYPQYLDGARSSLPVELLACQPLDARKRLIATCLTSGRIPVADIPVQESCEPLIQSWIRYGLLARDKDGLRLTATGAWMSGVMLEEFISKPALVNASFL